MGYPVRVLIAKPGLDGHDRGAKIITLGLRDEGMEVIYSGLRQSPEQIAEIALQEDVDVVGLSCLSGAHRSLFPKVLAELKEKGLNETVVICGGMIPDDDIDFLKESGISEVFCPGTSIKEVASYIRNAIELRNK